MNGRAAALLCGVLVLRAARPSLAQARAGAPAADPLRQLDAALKELTARVSPAVVRVLATGYGPSGVGGQSVLTRQQGMTDYFDLALLKVEATGLPTPPFADFRDVTQGQLVIAVGSPLGLDNSVGMGIISSVAREADPQSPVVFVRTDAPINPGSSGGALVDVEGRLVVDRRVIGVGIRRSRRRWRRVSACRASMACSSATSCPAARERRPA